MIKIKGIYKFTCVENGKVYIGQSTNIENRIKTHFNNHTNENIQDYKTKFYSALRKYGFESFSFEVLEAVEDIELLNSRERYWIEKYDSFNRGYNSTPGGDAVAGSGENHPNAKNTNQDILELKRKLKETNISQYELALEYRITQSSVSMINSGRRWGEVGEFKYPIRKIEARKKGEKHRNSVLTDEIVKSIRERYQMETGQEIYEDYKDICSYPTFERALTGRTYKYLPIYRKKEGKWTK